MRRISLSLSLGSVERTDNLRVLRLKYKLKCVQSITRICVVEDLEPESLSQKPLLFRFFVVVFVVVVVLPLGKCTHDLDVFTAVHLLLGYRDCATYTGHTEDMREGLSAHNIYLYQSST